MFRVGCLSFAERYFKTHIDILEDSKLLETTLLSHFVKNVYNLDEKISNTEPDEKLPWVISKQCFKKHKLNAQPVL